VTGYWDIVVVLLIATVMLVVLDWRITQAFTRHEKVESSNFATLAMSSEAAVGAAQTAARHLREIREESAATKQRVVDLGEDVRMHDKRLGAVEERVMRAALLVPAIRKPGGND
jgi:hypothetical protein